MRAPCADKNSIRSAVECRNVNDANFLDSGLTIFYSPTYLVPAFLSVTEGVIYKCPTVHMSVASFMSEGFPLCILKLSYEVRTHLEFLYPLLKLTIVISFLSSNDVVNSIFSNINITQVFFSSLLSTFFILCAISFTTVYLTYLHFYA